jgi:amino acid adenylation domain-containing protein
MSAFLPLQSPAADGCRPRSSTFCEFEIEEVEQSIPDRFAKQVRKHAFRTAVKTDRAELTYQALNRTASQVAHGILGARGQKLEPVAFLLDHGALPLVAILGILKAGKIVVPLDPSFPRARLGHLQQHSQAGLILTDSTNASLAREVSGGNCLVINLDELSLAADDGDPRLSVPPETPAYILYTSGSTGDPKGVIQNHRNLLHAALRFTNSLQICPEDRCTLVAACSVAASVSDIFQTLLNGASLLPYDLRGQGFSGLAHWLIDQKATIYHSGPTAFRQFAGRLTGSDSFPDLRVVRLGGEAVTCSDVDLFRRHFGPPCSLVVSLAATETGLIRQHVLDSKTTTGGMRLPVGHPVTAMDIRLVGEDGDDVGPERMGEIVVRSSYLSPGYWRDPERTQAAFRPDDRDQNHRLYYTGDLGLMRPDGCLEYRGRKDEQVKIRGHRVETGEVEAALLGLGTVQEAAVVACDRGSNGPRLVAYVVAPPAARPTVPALRHALREKLPDFMVPSQFVFLDHLPLTDTGKVDRRSLPVPDDSRPALESSYCPPRNLVQAMMKEVWETILNIRPIGIHDSYFDLGGDSLAAEKILSWVQEQFAKTFYPGILVTAPTVDKLTDLVMGAAPAEVQAPLVEIQKGAAGRQKFFFLHGDLSGAALSIGISKGLRKEQPFYVIHPHGLMGWLVPSTIEAMAADNLRTLRAFQPEGPYFLGGYCKGGLIAFELARQLRLHGQKVSGVVIVAPPPDMKLAVTPPDFSPLPQPSIQSVGEVHDLSRIESGTQRFWALNSLFQKACRNYLLRPFPDRLIIFQPLDDVRTFGPAMLWKAAASQAEVHFVPGGHLMDKPEHVKALASGLRTILDRNW